MNNDHYVPQFYLRNFEILETSNLIQKNHIFSYMRGFNPKSLPIKSVACEIDFDRFEESKKGFDDTTYNKILKTSEDLTPSIITKILYDSSLTINDEDIEILAWFISLLIVRNPVAHNFFKNEILKHYKNNVSPRIQQECVNNKQSIYNLLRAKQPNITDEMIEKVIQWFLREEDYFELNENDENKAYIRGNGIAYVDYIKESLLSKNWHLLQIKNSSKNVFITSDNPVSFLHPRFLKFSNAIDADSPFFFPLSPQKALYIHPYKFQDKTMFIGDKQVKLFINETMLRAKENVYSNIKSDEIKKNFDNKYFDLSHLNYEFNLPSYFEFKSSLIAMNKHFAETRNE